MSAQYGAFEDESRIYLVMQYAAGGDLFDELRRLGGRMSEQETVGTVLVPFLRAMSHLHERVGRPAPSPSSTLPLIQLPLRLAQRAACRCAAWLSAAWWPGGDPSRHQAREHAV